MNDPIQQWRKENRTTALATVVRTWGSAPRAVGAKMLITEDLQIHGSVSGGCVESAVIEEAQKCLRHNTSKWLSFGVADDTAWDVGLACGGSIEVFVEPLDWHWWDVLHSDIESKRIAITALSSESSTLKMIFDENGDVLYQSAAITDGYIAQWREIALRHHQSEKITHQEHTLLVDIQQPKPHLIIVGGVHVAIPLQVFAHEAGFRISIVDPRKVFASKERFPTVQRLLHSYPQEAFVELGLTAQTYVAILTHDPKIDDPALIHALPSPAPYIGVLSSKRTHEKRVIRLREAGLADDLIKRIQTPIGLNIGAKTPAEIALSIMAEIIHYYRKHEPMIHI